MFTWAEMKRRGRSQAESEFQIRRNLSLAAGQQQVEVWLREMVSTAASQWEGCYTTDLLAPCLSGFPPGSPTIKHEQVRLSNSGGAEAHFIVQVIL